VSSSRGMNRAPAQVVVAMLLITCGACSRAEVAPRRHSAVPPTVVPVTTPPADFSGVPQPYTGYWFGYKFVLCGSRATFNIPPAFRAPLDLRIRAMLGDSALHQDALPEPVFVSLLATRSSISSPPSFGFPELFVNQVLELRRAGTYDCPP
jgi:hypothetical protein